MPIYWNEANPAGTTVTSANDLLNQVALVSYLSNSGLKHPQNAKLNYTSGMVPSAAMAFPTDWVTPPIYSSSAPTTRIKFQRKGSLPMSISNPWRFDTNGGVTGVWWANNGTGVRALLVHVRGSGGGSTNGLTLNNDRAGGGGGSALVAVVSMVGATILETHAGLGGVGWPGLLGGDGQNGADSYVKVTYANGEWIKLIAQGGFGGTRAEGGGYGLLRCEYYSGGVTANTDLWRPSDVGRVLGNNLAKVVANFLGTKSGTGTGSYGKGGAGTYTDPYPSGNSYTIDLFAPQSTTIVGWGGSAPDLGIGNGNDGAPGCVTLFK